jgi:hypothetical protein
MIPGFISNPLVSELFISLFSSSAPSAPSAVKKIQNNHKSYKMSPLNKESAAVDEDLMYIWSIAPITGDNYYSDFAMVVKASRLGKADFALKVYSSLTHPRR